MKSKSLNQNLVLLLLSLIGIVILTEALLRIGGTIVSTSINSSENTDKSSYKILCIGDSSTYGLGSTNIETFSFPAQLQKLLDENIPGQKFEVVNLGKPGINSSQVLYRFRKNLITYNPDLVLVMVGINDPWNLEESTILKFYNAGALQRLYLKSQLLLNRLRLYQFFKLTYISSRLKRNVQEKKLNIPLFSEENKVQGFAFSQSHSSKSKALFKSLENNITNLKLIAESTDTDIIFMKYHNHGWGSPEKIINATYDKLNVPVVDNETLFRKATASGLEVRGKDGWHPNDLGYRLIAENIYKKMLELKLIYGEQNYSISSEALQ